MATPQDFEQHTTRTRVKGNGRARPGAAPASDDNTFPLSALTRGGRDKRGRKVEDILWSVPDFKIYKTPEGVSPHFSDDAATSRKQMKHYLSLGAELAYLNHLNTVLAQGGATHRLLQFVGRKIAAAASTDKPSAARSCLVAVEREIARAIAQALSGDVEDGRETLKALTLRIEKKLRNTGRVKYFGVCVAVAAVIAAAAWWWFGDALAISSTELAIVAIMGSCGALLSTAVGLRSLQIDASASQFLNFVYGGQRMLVGVLGAVVLYFALKAGVLMDTIPWAATADGDAADIHKLAFISVLAGFSERLVPNLLDRKAEGANGDGAKTAESPATVQ